MMYSFEDLDQKLTKGEWAVVCALGQCFAVGLMYLAAKFTGVGMGLEEAGLISLATMGIGVFGAALYHGAKGLVKALVWLLCQTASVWVIKAVLGIALIKAALILGIYCLFGLAALGLVFLATKALITSQAANNVDNGHLFGHTQRIFPE